MKALVTGATGFVGSHLVDVLLRSGVEVTALARSQHKAAVLTGHGVRIITGDLHTEAALKQAVRDQDIVYHVAGAVAARSEADFLHANREGTRNIVGAAEAAGRGRFVLVSSLAAGGPATRGSPRVPGAGSISCKGAIDARHASNRSAGATAALSNPAPGIGSLPTPACSVRSIPMALPS